MTKFHYTVQLVSSSLADRRPARKPARERVSELGSVMEFGLKTLFNFIQGIIVVASENGNFLAEVQS